MKHPRIIATIEEFVRKHKLGFLKIPRQECMTLLVPNTKYYEFFWSPDLVFYGKHSRPKKWRENKWTNFPPDLALQVVDGFNYHDVAAKSLRLISCGVKTVLCVDMKERAIHVYRRGKPLKIFGAKDTLDLSGTIPGLKINIDATLPERRPISDPPKRTLFNPNSFPADRRPGGGGISFTSWLSQLSLDPGKGWYDQEVGIFEDVSRSEAFLVESQTDIAGPLVIEVDGKRIDLSRQIWSAKGWVEDDRLQFQSCSARGILLCEIGTTFAMLAKLKAWRSLNMVLACGFGIPRTTTRRLLHRLSKQFNLPVYVLADNDTWGYSIYAILKRGSMAPFQSVPQLAVKDARFLGLRAMDFNGLPDPKRIIIKWQDRWDLRLNAMMKYTCFQSSEWQNELQRFRRQHGKFESAGLIYGLWRAKGAKGSSTNAYRMFIKEYLLPRIEEGRWLE